MPPRGTGTLLLAMAVLPLAAPAQVPGIMPYGSRAGMQVTVVSQSGIDSARAVIRVVHTEADALAYCRVYVGDPSRRCVEETRADLAGVLRDRIEGDCPRGVFTDLWGDRYRFAGPLDPPSDLGAVWAFVDADGGPPLDGSMASGYGVVLDQFRALCPGRLVRLRE
ncbi:MAG: hypothetical protein KDK12_03960 [Rhodobacteraceae bacterium]|nr:hypothetical protein [Paracoccaceae bacterium]